MVSDSQPCRLVSRGLRLGRLGLSLTGSYLGYQVQNIIAGKAKNAGRRDAMQEAIARKITKELQSLKGPAMKLGQALSMQFHLLSPEAIKELAQLQMQAPPMHPTLARATFRSAMGKTPEELFKSFEDQPIAAASLGQVHRAMTRDGEDIAVKIQYPGIRTALENDFKLLRSATLPARMSGHITRPVLDEIAAGVARETDYVLEADHIEYFGRSLADLPYVRVPRVFRDYSNTRILTMSFMEGATLENYLRGRPSQTERNLLGYRLGELFHYQVRRLQVLHTDPHPGNYLFTEGGSVGLIDFGSVYHFSPRFSEIVECFADRVWEKSETQMERFGRLVCGERASTSPRLVRRTVKLMIAFLNQVFPGGPVDFGDVKVINGLTNIWTEFMENKLIIPDLIFSSRAEMGLYNLLHRIRAIVDTTAILENVSKMPSCHTPRPKLRGTSGSPKSSATENA